MPKTRSRTRMEMRIVAPASGPIFSLAVLVALFAFGPEAVVCATLIALGLIAAWFLVRRTGPKAKPPPPREPRSSSDEETYYVRRRNE